MNFWNMIAKMLLGVTSLSVNSTCSFYIYQDKLPKNASKLRKF